MTAGQQRYFLSHHRWEEQGAFTDTTGTTIATPHRAVLPQPPSPH
jgi:hypothetical protein